MKTFGSWLAIVSLALAVGCGKSDPSVPKESGAVPGKPAAPTEPAEIALVALADKPDVYVQTVFNSIGSGDSRAFWRTLPARYQADVTSLKNEFAVKMDADVWNKAFVVVDKLAQVLKTKKDMLLASPFFQLVPPPFDGMVKQNWDTVAGLIGAVAQAEIKTIDGLKGADPATFLTVTGNTLLGGVMKVADSVPMAADQLSKIRKVKVSLVKVEGDKATLKVETEGEPAKDDEFKKVDGKWLPASLVDGWDANMAAAKANLADMQFPPQMKNEFVATLNVVDGRLTKLLAANDQATFDAELGELMKDVEALNNPMAPSGPTGTGAPGGLPKPTGSFPTPTLPGPTSPGPTIPGPTITPPTLPGSGASTPPSSLPPSSGPSLSAPDTKLPSTK